MKISIITVCYNAAATLETTLLSVLNQTYRDVEYLIIDGGSTDGTVDIIRKYEHRIAKWISEPDRGIYDAMNKGIRLATSDWRLFMNAGDTFVDESVLTHVFERITPDADVVYGDNLMIYDSGSIYHKAGFFSKRDINLPFNHQSALVRTRLAKNNLFDPTYKIAGDYHFFYRLYRAGCRFQYIPLPIANYAMDGLSQKYVIKTFREVCEIRQRKKDLSYLFSLAFLKLKLWGARVLPACVIDTYRSILNR